MKLLPTIVAVAFANNGNGNGGNGGGGNGGGKPADLPDGTHDSSCLFPNADFEAVFADPFSQFSFSSDPVSSESYGELYAEGTTVSFTTSSYFAN